jgi:hypothetical protein
MDQLAGASPETTAPFCVGGQLAAALHWTQEMQMRRGADGKRPFNVNGRIKVQFSAM